MRPLWLLLILTALMLPASLARGALNPVRRSRQCIVVLAPNWNSTNGVLRAFERESASGPWKPRGPEIPVVLGKKGLGWGLGIVNADAGAKPRKIEGDNKVPAGLFRLTSVFGYATAKSASWVRLPYLPVTKNSEGVDDPRSRHYNRIVDRTKVARIDWRSSEQMRRDDRLYKWGVVVDHNPGAVPGAGSMIFFHVWKSSSSPTAGCTAMPEKDLVNLIRWLDPAARPILAQMPRESYAVFQSKYDLPEISPR